MRKRIPPAARQLRRGPEHHVDARRGERGSSRLKAIVWLMIMGTLIFVGIKVVPILFGEYQFQDAMKNAARFATVSRQSPDDIRKGLLKEAANQDLPVKAEDIKVTADNGNVTIEADFSVTVDLALYQWTLNFHPSASNNNL